MLLCHVRIHDLLRDTDSELEEGEDKESTKQRKVLKAKRRGDTQKQTWLKEENEDITDFMDISAAKKVLGKFCCVV